MVVVSSFAKSLLQFYLMRNLNPYQAARGLVSFNECWSTAAWLYLSGLRLFSIYNITHFPTSPYTHTSAQLCYELYLLKYNN